MVQSRVRRSNSSRSTRNRVALEGARRQSHLGQARMLSKTRIDIKIARSFKTPRSRSVLPRTPPILFFQLPLASGPAMNALRPVVNRVVSRAATNQPCRRCYASIDQVIYKGIRRDSREESRSFERPRGSRDARNSRSSYDSSSYDHSNRRYEPKQEYTREPRRAIQKVDQASEWIYGTSVVEAALKSKRRTLHRLYVYAGENRTEANKDRDIKFKNMARGLKIDVREVTDAGMLDSVSKSSPVAYFTPGLTVCRR